LETFGRLLQALERVLELAQRAGDDELLEWSGLVVKGGNVVKRAPR
jgi:hypothetical protein